MDAFRAVHGTDGRLVVLEVNGGSLEGGGSTRERALQRLLDAVPQ